MSRFGSRLRLRGGTGPDTRSFLENSRPSAAAEIMSYLEEGEGVPGTGGGGGGGKEKRREIIWSKL
ncbi:hypothetical protein AAMO2058_001440600 [Amorphochlora amoebiformis]